MFDNVNGQNLWRTVVKIIKALRRKGGNCENNEFCIVFAISCTLVIDMLL